MNPTAVIGGPASDARVLERAEGVLIGLRRCPAEAAFAEIVDAAKRHRVPTLGLAGALVALAAGGTADDDAACAARYEWSALLER